MVLTRQEKEGWVIKLCNQGKTIREIAELVHMSFADISSIIRRETGEDEEQNRIRMSKGSQALKLFEEGNAPVKVAIKLDMETGEVDRLYKEYWNLKGLYHLRQVYGELRGDIAPFLKLYHLTIKEGLGPQQVVNALKIAEKVPFLESEYDSVKDNVYALKRQQEKLENELYRLNKYKDISSNQLESLRKEENKLRRLIDRLENNEEYTIVEKKVREILDSKRLIIQIALSAVLIAIRNDPSKELLNDLANEPSPANEYYRQKLLELGHICYEKLVRDCINSILDSKT